MQWQLRKRREAPTSAAAAERQRPAGKWKLGAEGKKEADRGHAENERASRSFLPDTGEKGWPAGT
jgi:hypothetical protein